MGCVLAQDVWVALIAKKLWTFFWSGGLASTVRAAQRSEHRAVGPSGADQVRPQLSHWFLTWKKMESPAVQIRRCPSWRSGEPPLLPVTKQCS